MESRVESALACPRRKKWEKRTVAAPIVEPTCAAFGTTKKQPRASNGGKIKRDPAVHDPTVRVYMQAMISIYMVPYGRRTDRGLKNLLVEDTGSGSFPLP